MEKQTELTIRSRTYHVEELDCQSVKVSGEIFGRSVRLLPGLDAALQKTLIDLGYPIGDTYTTVSHLHGDREGAFGSLTYPYTPKGWYKIFYTPFAASLRIDPKAIALREGAAIVSRRFHLAEALGLKLSRKKYLSDPIADIERAFHEYTAEAWEEYDKVEVEYHYLVDDYLPPSFRFDYDDHTYTLDFTIEPGDRAFLALRLQELKERIADQGEGGTVSKVKRTKGA